MMKCNEKVEKGITLIALIITIIVLLILAGVSISLVMGNKGILGRAEEASIISKIKEIEEIARLLYMDRKIDEILEGDEAKIAGVMSDLKEKGYIIRQEGGENKIVTGIVLSQENITIERNTQKEVKYTLIYEQGTTIKYFAEVEGQYYEIEFDNENITISTEATKLDSTIREPEVIVESNDSSIIEAMKTKVGEILLTAKDKLGDVEIIVREKNSNVTKKIIATTRIPLTSISILPNNETINVGETLNLEIILEPSNTTDEIVWNSSDANIAIVSNSGVVTALARGIVTIIASTNNESNDISNTCTITVLEESLINKVKENSEMYYGKKVIGYTANGISEWRIFYADDENVFIIATDYLPADKAKACSNTLSTSGKYVVYWNSVPAVADTTNVNKFSPVTNETKKWQGSYGSNANGKYVSTLLDISKWSSFIDSDYAEMAIGSPTLNMWVASWNTKYPDEKIYCNNDTTMGYYMGETNSPTSKWIAQKTMSARTGYKIEEKDNMYYPHKSIYNGCGGYWLASPAIGDARSNNVTNVYSDGGVGYGSPDYGDCGIRPVVCLKSSVKMIENADGTISLK